MFVKNFKLVEYIKQEKHFKFTENLPLITWENVIDCFNLNIEKRQLIKVQDNFGVILHEVELQSVQVILEQFNRLRPNHVASAHMYISFSTQSETFGWHKDVSDVLFWQAIGSTKFLVEDNQIYEYDLQPNDLLYIPKKMKHCTIPNSPRVGISMGLDFFEN